MEVENSKSKMTILPSYSLLLTFMYRLTSLPLAFLAKGRTSIKWWSATFAIGSSNLYTTFWACGFPPGHKGPNGEMRSQVVFKIYIPLFVHASSCLGDKGPDSKLHSQVDSPTLSHFFGGVDSHIGPKKGHWRAAFASNVSSSLSTYTSK